MHNMESSLECEVCMVPYNSNEHRPRFLPCGHSMCSSCIIETIRTCHSNLSCPFCRTECGTAVKTVDDFPTAFALLNLIDNSGPKASSGALSPRDKENKVYLEKKQAEYDCSVSHLSNCNDQLAKLLQAKELQETTIKSIEIEQKKLEEDKKKALYMTEQLDVITATGIAIIKNLDDFQNRVVCSTNLSSLEETSQDGQRYYTASKEWITSTSKSIIKDETHMMKEVSV